MRRVRILGYMYQIKSQENDDTFCFQQQVEDGVKRFVPLDDDIHIYVVTNSNHLKHFYAFTDVVENSWYESMFKCLCRMHDAFDMTGVKCPIKSPTEKEWQTEGHTSCGFYETYEVEQHVCPHGPLYVFPMKPSQGDWDEEKNVWCIVHPDEYERMERILNGTDNPLYDFVHELRYNPNISSKLGVERQEAEEDMLLGGERNLKKSKFG